MSLCLWLAAVAQAADYFTIRVTDAATGRGVPLVELRTVNDVSWWTDSAGRVAIDDPGLIGNEVFFHVQSPGYEWPADGFGYRGVKLRVAAGGTAELSIKRVNIAERLYRVTGEGIYGDSVLAGQPVPTRLPVLNGQVMGQDTVIATPYRGLIYWFWGDTERIGYPLGHFGVSGATSTPPANGGLDPAVGVDLEYFVDANGFSRPMCPLPELGLRWLEGAFTLREQGGRERLVGRLAVMKDLGTAHEWHLMVFNDEKAVFESVQRWDLHEPHQSAHPFRVRANGVEYCYLYPDFRVKADLEAVKDLSQYEAFTCVAGDGRWRDAETRVDRDAGGRVVYDWKRGAERLTQRRLAELAAQKQLAETETSLRLVDVETARPLSRRPESVAWNAYRRQWIAFAADKPGEAWFAAADTPVGPWGYARRVAMHGDYNFYNLAHHAFFDQEGGRRVYFEGTYTDSFSAARTRTPRYNYNQLMYRLDLADARLQLPLAWYAVRDPGGRPRIARPFPSAPSAAASRIEHVAFFALPPLVTTDGTLPIYEREAGDRQELVREPPHAGARPLFVTLPMTTAPAEWKSPALVPLWWLRDRATGERYYFAGESLPANSEAIGEALGRVWRATDTLTTFDLSAKSEP